MRPIKNLDFGFGDLTEVSYLEKVFEIPRRTAMKYLRAFKIQPVYVGKDVYFSLPTLKRILFVLTRPGGSGFVMPGSTAKNNPRICRNPEFLFEVPDDVLAEAAKPETLLEMAASEGRNIDAIKKLATRVVGRPRKEMNDGN